ncbi:MFS transporter, partial [Pseudomonas aeruginosa]
FVLLMLASSIMSAVGAEELLGVANRIQSDTYRNATLFRSLGGAVGVALMSAILLALLNASIRR